jgi:hypothetical protein
MKGEVSKQTLETIEKVMATNSAIATSDAVKIKAAERALAKIAPFHRAKNSVGDALLTKAGIHSGYGSRPSPGLRQDDKSGVARLVTTTRMKAMLYAGGRGQGRALLVVEPAAVSE